MRISEWSSDVCSSDLLAWPWFERIAASPLAFWWLPEPAWFALPLAILGGFWLLLPRGLPGKPLALLLWLPVLWPQRSEERRVGKECVSPCGSRGGPDH